MVKYADGSLSIPIRLHADIVKRQIVRKAGLLFSDMPVEDAVLDQQLSELELYELTVGPQAPGAKGCPVGPGSPSSEEYYTQFLGLYILKMDLLNAKFLWKRIPTPVKGSSTHLKKLWNLGQLLIRRQITAFFQAADKLIEESNSETLIYIVRQICERQRQRVTDLVTSAYSCVSIEFLSSLLNLPESEAILPLTSRGWHPCSLNKYLLRPSDSSVTIVKPESDSNLASQTTNNEIMSKLAEFVCFIENH
ncbi:unnamed protein product [Calicophoron daubneyi]|uniref:CSN8/PSMD8/EIF3K domain-containing protein n=1 Tax=Calicophoron daubneyi TaxID=300641 RepID=A0AAV2TBW6_CALDB